MKKILVAYDGSLLSRKAIEEAKRQVRLEDGSEVSIISVVKTPGPRTNVSITRSIGNDLSEKFQPQMDSIQKEFEQDNIPIYTDIFFNEDNENPGKKICKYANDNDIDLIIAGSRGLSKVKSIFLGSVSSNIVHHATCPVLIMK